MAILEVSLGYLQGHFWEEFLKGIWRVATFLYPLGVHQCKEGSAHFYDGFPGQPEVAQFLAGFLWVKGPKAVANFVEFSEQFGGIQQQFFSSRASNYSWFGCRLPNRAISALGHLHLHLGYCHAC